MGAREGDGGRFRRLGSALALGPRDARGGQDVEPQDRMGKRQIRKEPMFIQKFMDYIKVHMIITLSIFFQRRFTLFPLT